MSIITWYHARSYYAHLHFYCAENPYPGTLFNRATGKKPGVNVNAGFHRSYEKDQVTAGNFLGALRCGNNTGPCVGPKGSLAPNSTLFIFWAGHGGNGMLFLPDMQAQTALYADDLVSALREARKRGFGRVVMYVHTPHTHTHPSIQARAHAPTHTHTPTQVR